jgi:uncharacterized protein YcbK (DUF882 family)
VHREIAPAADACDGARNDGLEISELTPPLLLAEAERGRPFGALAPLHLHNVNTLKANDLRLYDEMGRIDEGAACALDELLGDARDRSNIRTTTIDRRTLQLMFRAAYHFRATRVELISGYREPGARREGQHGFGKAIDFRLPKVSASALAAYLRTQKLVGVGVYTNPLTQYVHLDVRERSYHWIDASPPGRTWRERALGVPRPARDASYERREDWPEGTAPGARALLGRIAPG